MRKLVLLTYSVSVVALSLFVVACPIGSKKSDREEIMYNLGISAPDEVKTNPIASDRNNVQISWTPVAGADYYQLYYSDSRTFLSGGDGKLGYMGDDVSVALNLEDGAGDRYVFWVVAGKGGGVKSKGATSGKSVYAECAVEPSFDVESVIDNGYLTLWFNTSARDSLIHSGEYIYVPRFEITRSDSEEPIVCTDSFWTSPEKLEGNSTYTYSVKAIIGGDSQDGGEGEQAAAYDLPGAGDIEISTSVDEYPRSATVLSVSRGKNNNPSDASVADAEIKGRIEVRWMAPAINGGLVEKAMQNGYSAVNRAFDLIRYECFSDGEPDESEGKQVTVLDRKTAPTFVETDAEGRDIFAFTDDFADVADGGEFSHEYRYRVVSYYEMVKEQDGSAAKKTYNKESETLDRSFSDVAWSLGKPMIHSMSASDVVKSVEEGTGNAEYAISVRLDIPHFADYGQAEVDVTRTCDSSFNSPYSDSFALFASDLTLNGDVYSFTDCVGLTHADDDDEHGWVYEVRLVAVVDGVKYVSAACSSNEVKSLPLTKPVDFISGAPTVSDKAANAGQIKISWNMADDAYLSSNDPSCPLSPNNVKVVLKRGNSSSSINDTIYDSSTGIGASSLQSNGTSRVFTDTTAEDGKTYYYSVRATYEDTGNPDNPYNGKEKLFSNLSGETLAAVTGLAATKGTLTDRVALSWTTVDAAKDYEVQYALRANDSWVSLLDYPTSGSYDFALGEAGELYKFRVYARDSEGRKVKACSNVADGSRLGMKYVNFRVLDASVQKDCVNVAWDAVEGATGYDLKIYADSACTKPLIEKSNLTELAYRFEASATSGEVFDGVSYPLSRPYFFVLWPKSGGKAVSDDDAKSKAVSGSWLQPPKNITATKSEHKDKVMVTWDAVSGSGITYNVYRRVRGETEWKEVVTGVSANEYSDPYSSSDAGSVKNNTVYEYTVSAESNMTESLKQNYFTEDSSSGYMNNVGLLLSTPEIHTNALASNGELVFKEVIGDRSMITYKLVLKNSSNTDGKTIDSYDTNESERKIKFIVPEADRDALFSVYACCNGNESEPWKYNNLSHKSVVEYANVAMREFIAYAITKNDDDWWTNGAPTSGSKCSGINENTCEAVFNSGCSHTIFKKCYDGSEVYFKLKGYTGTNGTALTSDKIRYGVSENGNYLVKSNLLIVGMGADENNGNVSVKLPDGSTAKIRYCNVNVIGEDSYDYEYRYNGIAWEKKTDTLIATYVVEWKNDSMPISAIVNVSPSDLACNAILK